MPITKSAKKQVRVNEKKRARGRAARSTTKTGITRAEKIIFSGEQGAQEAVVAAISSLDKAAEKKIIHPNNAARRKSRLMKKLNEAKGSPLPELEPEKPGK